MASPIQWVEFEQALGVGDEHGIWASVVHGFPKIET